MINIDTYVPPRTWQYRLKSHTSALQNTRLSVCVFKNVLPCVTGDLRDYISPLKLPLTLCTSNSVLCHCGQHLKEVWKCVQLALYSSLSNPFWVHNGALLNNSKSSEKGQLQAWPQCLSTDFMRKKKKKVCVIMRTCVCSVPSVKQSLEVPVTLKRVGPSNTFPFACTEKYVNCPPQSIDNMLIELEGAFERQHAWRVCV